MTITRAAHLVGGTRMATRAKDDLVDANQKVFGVDTVYLGTAARCPRRDPLNRRSRSWRPQPAS